MIKKVDCKIVLFILILFMVFLPNISKAAKVSVPQVKSVSVVEQETTKVKVKWKKVSKATGYRVYVFDYTSKKYKYCGETKSTYMTIKKLKSAATYKVKVKAYKKIGRKRYYGKYSSEKQFVTRPGTVSGTAIKERTNNSITIKWNKVTRAKGYQVYAKLASSKNFKCYGSTSKNTFTIKNLRYAEEYVIMVKAYKNLNGKKLFSKEYKSINTVTAPNKLSNVKIENDSKSTIRISWNKLARITGYKIYQYNPSNKKWDIIETTTSNSVKVKNLKLGVEYKFRVKAYLVYKKVTYNGTITTLSDMIYLGKPKNLEVTFDWKIDSNGKKRVDSDIKKLKWDKVDLATGYMVYLYDEAAKTEKLYTTTKETNATLSNLGEKKYYRIYVKAYTTVNGKKVYGDKAIIRTGIDVSKWQETIDWQKVRKTGINFAMMRCRI